MRHYRVTMYDPFTHTMRTVRVTARDRASAQQLAAEKHPDWEHTLTRLEPAQ